MQTLKPTRQTRAFTLVELLVVIAIVAILAGLAFGAYGMAMDNARRTVEQNAARQAILAYIDYANDHNGRLMPGISETAVKLPDGTRLPGYLSKRWPYRLSEYFGGNYAGVAVVNEAEAAYEDGGHYVASVYPSLGLNTTFVGGNYDTHYREPRVNRDERSYGSFAVTRLGSAVAPDKLIVFASATADNSDGSKTHGNFYVLAPNSPTASWAATYNENSRARAYGFVHPRWNGKAVVAHLDGSVAVLDFDELSDMTRWSNQAAKSGDRDWELGQN